MESLRPQNTCAQALGAASARGARRPHRLERAHPHRPHGAEYQRRGFPSPSPSSPPTAIPAPTSPIASARYRTALASTPAPGSSPATSATTTPPRTASAVTALHPLRQRWLRLQSAAPSPGGSSIPIACPPLAYRPTPRARAISINAQGSDSVPGDLLTYSISGLPPGVSLGINPSTGILSGIIGYNAASTGSGAAYYPTITLHDQNSAYDTVIVHPGRHRHQPVAERDVRVHQRGPEHLAEHGGQRLAHAATCR